MPIKFAGNTTADFNVTRTTTSVQDVAPSASQADLTFVDSAIEIIVDQTTYDTAMEFSYPAATGKTWLHFDIRVADFQGDSRLDGRLMSFYDVNDNLLGGINITNGSHQAHARGDSDVYSAATTLANLTLITIDVSIDVTPSDITVEYFRNGVSLGSATVTNTVGYGTPARTVLDVTDCGFGTAYGGYVYISQVIQTEGDESTISKKLFALTPNSNGHYADWVGDYTDLTDLNTTTGINTSALNSRQSWGFSSPTVPSAYAIQSLVTNYSGEATGASIGNFEPFVRIGSTDYDQSAVPLGGGYATSIPYDVNPSTLLSWTPADIATIEQGIKTTT